jgi:isopenicillin N synthase-like dioxygenase
MADPESLLSLPVLSLNLLEAGNKAESAKLLSACKEYGFFYLDLDGSAKLSEDLEALLSVMEQYFSQTLEEKMRDSFQSNVKG